LFRFRVLKPGGIIVLIERSLTQRTRSPAVLSEQLSPNNVTKKLRTLLSVPGDFVAVTTKERRFEYLVDRKVILEQVAKQLASQTEERT
jgi:hypothetical protein